MADLTKTVEIIFGGKNEVGGTINDVCGQLDKFETTAMKVIDPFADIGKSVLKLDAYLAALAVGSLAYAIKESSAFNSSFALISTSIDATGDSLSKYRDDVLNYATTSVKSIDDINASLYTAAQAGVKYSDSLAFIAKAEELSVANKANLNTTVDLLTGTMNAYGFKMTDIGHINDVFFQSTLIGKQTIDELGVSMGQVVGIAANSGVSFEDLSAAIATLTAKGMGTEAAITAVKNVITTIVSPSKDAAGAAKELGLNFSLTELTAKGFAAMLHEIMLKTGGSKEKMVELFSEVRAMNGALMLTGDSMAFFNDALKQIEGSTGASEAAYQKMVVTFANQGQMLLNTAKVSLIAFGTELEPMAAKVAGSLGAVFAGIKIGIDQGAFDPLFNLLDSAAQTIATFLQGVAKALPEALSKLNWDSLIAALKGLAGAFGSYFGELDLTKADDLASALQTVVDIGTGLVNMTKGMVEAFKPFVEKIVEFFLAVAKGDPQAAETIGRILGLAVAIKELGLYVAAGILTLDEMRVSMKGLFEVVGGGAQVLWNGFQILIEAIKGAFVILGGAAIELVDSLSFGLYPGLDAARKKMEEFGKSISFDQDALDAKAGLDLMMKGFSDLGNTAKDSSGKVTTVKTSLDALPTEKSTLLKIVDLPNCVIDLTKVKTAVGEIPDKKTIGVEVLADGTKIETTKDMIYKTFPDGQVLITNIGTKADIASLTATKSKIDEVVPASKVMEIQAKIDEAKIKAMSDIVQKSIEWDAKVNIAQIETAGKVVIATFASIDNTITSTGQTLSSMMGDYVNSLGKGGSSFIENEIQAESRRRDAALTMQEKMTNAQVELLQKQAERIKEGGAMIEIDGKGLQPHLEAFMFEILSAIQIKANAEGMKFLVGTT